MRFHNFWCMFKKLKKAGKRFVQLRSFIKIPKKHFYRLEKPSKLPFFFPPLFQTIMDKSLGTHLRFWGVFQFTQVQPLPSPHKQCWMCVSRIFFRVSTLYRVGRGRTARKFPKGCTVLRGNREMTEKYEYWSTVPRTFVQDCRFISRRVHTWTGQWQHQEKDQTQCCSVPQISCFERWDETNAWIDSSRAEQVSQRVPYNDSQKVRQQGIRAQFLEGILR